MSATLPSIGRLELLASTVDKNASAINEPVTPAFEDVAFVIYTHQVRTPHIGKARPEWIDPHGVWLHRVSDRQMTSYTFVETSGTHDAKRSCQPAFNVFTFFPLVIEDGRRREATSILGYRRRIIRLLRCDARPYSMASRACYRLREYVLVESHVYFWYPRADEQCIEKVVDTQSWLPVLQDFYSTLHKIYVRKRTSSPLLCADHGDRSAY